MMMLTSLFLLTLSRVNGQENAFQTLGITLPTNLMQHITAIYQDDLYVFGGRNASSGTWNDQFWKLPLSAKFALNGAKDDVVSTLLQNDWELLTVAPPAYGDSTNNEFICEGQCSVVIGQYLYIVGPYASTTSSLSSFSPDWIYRLDLSPTTPLFAADTDFPSTTNYSIATRYPCVTAVNETMYTLSGVYVSTLSTEAVSYDTSAASQTPITGPTAGRFYAACAPNKVGSEIYLAGGRNQAVGVPGVDTYDILADSWTNLGSVHNFDTILAGTKSRMNTKCFTSPYAEETLECVGGLREGGVVAQNSVIWNYVTAADEENVALFAAVMSAGVETYEFVNDGYLDDAGTIVLVTGGGIATEAYDTIQYAVRYTLNTHRPTAAPTQMPSSPPTKSPVLNPTKSPVPSASPTRAPSDHPSRSPTTDPTMDPLPGPTPQPTTARPTHSPTQSRSFGEKLSDAFGGNPDCYDTWVACNSLVFILLLVIVIVFIVYWVLGAVWYKRRQNNRPLPPSMNQDANVEMGGGGGNVATHTTANKWKSAWELEQEAKAGGGNAAMGGGPVGDVGGGW